MELQISERLVLLSILPAEGDYSTLKIVRELRESLSFNEGEHKKYNLRNEEGKIFWNNDAGEPKEIPIGEKAKDIIVNAFKELSEQKKLRIEYMELYERFVGDKT